jgi:lipid II:glycine glycyltransferase (peptidoglycan interpeptide bridge formation enzyme)
MWGAAESLENTSDPWYGFTAFKLKFGGTYVEYMDSYDFVINRPTYNLFNFANDLRWKILKTLK